MKNHPGSLRPRPHEMTHAAPLRLVPHAATAGVLLWRRTQRNFLYPGCVCFIKVREHQSRRAPFAREGWNGTLRAHRVEQQILARAGEDRGASADRVNVQEMRGIEAGVQFRRLVAAMGERPQVPEDRFAARLSSRHSGCDRLAACRQSRRIIEKFAHNI